MEQFKRVFEDSFGRCVNDPSFFTRFYEIFLTSSEEVAAKFRDTDLDRQQVMLRTSLDMIVAAAGGNPEGVEHLNHIAKVHDRHHRDVRPELYDLWLDCLMKTVREFDPRFNQVVETAWRKHLEYGIATMKERY